MPSASALRTQIEHALEKRFPAALTPAPRTFRETAATGIEAVDLLLEGGLPVGAISEITGPGSSGRTSLTLAFLARRTQMQQACAWVDAHDAFDSESAAANGVMLKQLLWVRCRDSGIEERAGEWVRPDFSRLDQALRATDLLLQAGGFAALVLDLGSTSPKHAARIEPATWFRFRQAADRTRCSLLVLAEEPLTQSIAAVVLHCSRVSGEPEHGAMLASCGYQVRTGRVAANIKALFLAGKSKPAVADWSANSIALPKASA